MLCSGGYPFSDEVWHFQQITVSRVFLGFIRFYFLTISDFCLWFAKLIKTYSMKKLYYTYTFLFLCLFFSGFSQTRTIVAYKNGVKLYESLLSDQDSIFLSATDTVHDIDGNVYRTLRIGNKIWMIDNLRTTHLNDGTPIANVTTENMKYENGESGALRQTPAYCWHNNLEYNKFKYGALYNWDAVGTFKLAPAGWRIATKEDWAELEAYLAENGYNHDGTKTTDGTVAKILKSMSSELYWVSSTVEGSIGNNLMANNHSGLNLIPAAYRDGNSWGTIGLDAAYWTCSQYDGTYSSSRRFSKDDAGINQDRKDLKQLALSVRCVKDLQTTPVAGAYTDAYLTGVANGLSTRLSVGYEDLRTKPFYEAPIDAGYNTSTGVPMSRTKGYSLSTYAFKSLWLNNDGATAALNCKVPFEVVIFETLLLDVTHTLSGLVTFSNL